MCPRCTRARAAREPKPSEEPVMKIFAMIIVVTVLCRLGNKDSKIPPLYHGYAKFGAGVSGVTSLLRHRSGKGGGIR